MSSLKVTAATPQSDTAFNKQAEAVCEALQNFTAIAGLNAPGPACLAMEGLISTTVCQLLTFLLTASINNVTRVVHGSHFRPIFNSFSKSFLVHFQSF
jgi:hypothetical protein